MSNFWIMAQLSEPKYAEELKFLAAELDYVERMIHRKRPLANLSWPSLGIFSRKDWRHYEHQLRQYANKLEKYAQGVDEGVLPVRFSVYNNAESDDARINVRLKVEHGRVDATRKAPERPARLDARPKPWKLKLPPLGLGFARSQIKITAHGVGAELSALGPRDGAALVNQVLHIHCTAQTKVSYELSSRNVEHETGQVEFDD